MLKARPVLSAEGEVIRVIGSLADVTESKASEERILHDAIHDNLTGLPNRELFFDRLEAALVQARRPGGLKPVVMVLDIDRLKTVNDSLGMSFGDSALLTVARRAARDLSPGDTLARLGGDEFVAVLTDLENVDAAVPVLERMLQAAAQVVQIGQNEKYDAARVDERHRDHALFTAFAPVDHPQIAIAMVVENAGFGAQSAAPIARRVFDYWLRGRYPSVEDIAAVAKGQATAPIGQPRQVADIPLPDEVQSAKSAAMAITGVVDPTAPMASVSSAPVAQPPASAASLPAPKPATPASAARAASTASAASAAH